jgi:hypothetical protein
MKKEKHYHNTKFTPEAIQQGWAGIDRYVSEHDKKSISLNLSVTLTDEKWSHDSEAEFFSDYQKKTEFVNYSKSAGYSKYSISIFFNGRCTDVSVTAPERSVVEEVHQIFSNWAPKCLVPNEEKSDEGENIVFVGHGRSLQWRELKDHLQDKHGYKIEAYEVGARAGHAIRDILDEMLAKSSFAILVMTGEDKDADGNLHARENVVHELGLFQGKLGFSRAIVLLEEGTSEFSNIHGIHQIRYAANNIKETFGEVLATLKREFETTKRK